MNSYMKNAILILAILSVCFFSTAMLGQKTGTCENCDCAHFPWPRGCDKCCGAARGTGSSVTADRSVLTLEEGLKSHEFRVTPETKFQGNI